MVFVRGKTKTGLSSRDTQYDNNNNNNTFMKIINVPIGKILYQLDNIFQFFIFSASFH